MYADLKARLQFHNQDHLIQFWDELSEESRQVLASQIEQIDFQLVARLLEGSDEGPNWSELAQRATPPPAIRSAELDSSSRQTAIAVGEEALRSGKVGLILVAGGQGTRLGFPHPKGMLPLGPVSRRTLFQILADRLSGIGQRYGRPVPLYLMTSPATHKETAEYFANSELSIAGKDLSIFCQGVMPAVDVRSGRILMDATDRIALSPDGHGGMLSAFEQSGCLAAAQDRGIEHLFYIQVDNPLAPVADPELIGHHIVHRSEMTTQVVAKANSLERVGNVVGIDGRVQIIEYSDLPNEVAQRKNADGSLYLWAGNIAVHVFALSFLQAMASNTEYLPFHRALKKTPFIDPEGKLQIPADPNAFKFERFIFDLLQHAKHAIAVEALKDEAFAPVKNANGAPCDSPQFAQEAMIRLHKRWLEAAGAYVLPGTPIEIHPSWALTPHDVALRVRPGCRFEQPTYLK